MSCCHYEAGRHCLVSLAREQMALCVCVCVCVCQAHLGCPCLLPVLLAPVVLPLSRPGPLAQPAQLARHRSAAGTAREDAIHQGTNSCEKAACAAVHVHVCCCRLCPALTTKRRQGLPGLSPCVCKAGTRASPNRASLTASSVVLGPLAAAPCRACATLKAAGKEWCTGEAQTEPEAVRGLRDGLGAGGAYLLASRSRCLLHCPLVCVVMLHALQL